MKRFFTLLSLFMLGITAINADNFVFVDKNGNVIEDGATITVTEFEEDAFGSVQLKSGLSVKNVGAPSNYSVRIHNEITRIDNGNVQVCFPVYCHNYTAVGTNKSEEGTLSTDEVKEIPLSFSISIQSDTACLAVAFPFTEPARLIAPP